MDTEQHKLVSLLETLISTAVGFVLSLILWFAIRYSGAYEIETDISAGFEITLLFTALSIARGYGVRRMFVKVEPWIIEQAKQLYIKRQQLRSKWYEVKRDHPWLSRR